MFKAGAARTWLTWAIFGAVGCLMVGDAGQKALAPEPEAVSPQPLPALSDGAWVSADGATITVPRMSQHRLAANNALSITSLTVTSGDTAWLIAQRLATDLGTLGGLNPGLDLEYLTPGQSLKVVPNFRGIIHSAHSSETLTSIALAYEIPIEQIASVNQAATTAPLEAGKPIFVPGIRPRNLIASRGVAARRSENSPQNASPDHGIPPTAPMSGEGWIWPLAEVQLFSEYGYREDGFHRGLDIAAPVGTPVVAAVAGRVVAAEWEGGYGLCVTILTKNGVITKYAHASQLLVEVGQEVSQGEPVIRVGSTGNSTGPHVHFEVLEGGEPMDPRHYLP